MEGGPMKRSVFEVFNDFRGRRDGVLKALTTDAEKFYQACDPDRDNLCLFGTPTGRWEVKLPVEEVPSEVPEPILGINFSRDGMHRSKWISIIAIHSDAWLISLAFYFGARFNFDKNERKDLFEMINKLPTLYEVVYEKQQQKLAATQSNGNKTKPSGKMPKSRSSVPQQKSQSSVPQKKRVQMTPTPPPKEESDSDEEEAEEQGSTFCGACHDDNGVDEFWIFCDVCERWFHGKCVKVTPTMAEHIKQYKCPSCSNKKARVH
ncbi:PHD finger protein ALFIN-LIKE 4-like [Heracleum sosnowskyi]|uniref:PHD finger protein ALFIN-LIKE n=1 Tax=Heracleum sosnowskyi TaxID=360622 RepID=A0AAD8JFA6_9APIA|nr:PHD finger protein ALFIN-LIKE 4-like [Heracleum sosnowskyi]